MSTKIAIAVLFAAITAHAQTPLPVGTYRHSELKPENRITLQNGVTTTILSIPGLDRGVWEVHAGCTFQDTVNPSGPHSQSVTPVPDVVQDLMRGLPFVPSSYLYKVAAISYDHNFPGMGFNSPDARPYQTWWFGLPVISRVLVLQADPSAYLVVESYGQVTPFLSQVFGYMLAVKISL